MQLLPLALVSLVSAASLAAQIGGNGSDGAFAPSWFTTLDTARGPYQFTSVVIPAGIWVRATGPNPLVILCQGTITIDGELRADGAEAQQAGTTPGAGGPGGYRGGYGSDVGGPAENGAGPGGGTGGERRGLLGPGPGEGGGGGHASPGQAGTGGFNAPGGGVYGRPYLLDVRGGSGGGGGSGHAGYGVWGLGGSGGGGVILLMADRAITIHGIVSADGGANRAPLVSPFNSPSPINGGAGSGGTILMRSLDGITVGGTVSARGGTLHWWSGWWNGNVPLSRQSGGDGFVRIDSHGSAPVLTGTVLPAPFALRLPSLRATDLPYRGGNYELSSIAAPGDGVLFFLSAGTANIPLPPFGDVLIDPATALHVGTEVVGRGPGHDPAAILNVPIPNDPRLIGFPLHAQAINLFTSTNRPLLTPRVSATIL